MVSRRRRPRGLIPILAACIECELSGRREHLPTADEFPESLVRRISFEAGGGFGWRISALATPRETPPPWKIVVVTGAPSWAEYWAPVLAAAPKDREMIVVDRPGFANSEPRHCVPKIETQAKALEPLLEAAPGQRVLLVGQSYGAAIATLMAAARPDRVARLVLLSGYFGKLGPTARLLINLGRPMLSLIPRDLRHAVLEATGQPRQLNPVFKLLNAFPFLVTLIHGDKDDFAPIEVARGIADITLAPSRLIEIQGGNHCLNEQAPPERMLAWLEASIEPSGGIRQVHVLKPERASPRAQLTLRPAH
jgi:pimeloyl-ACP methyl ester carboxylesterase